MLLIERTMKACRIIVRLKGVGLSMLQNIKPNYRKNKCLRNNRVLKYIFVTFLNINSVVSHLGTAMKKSPGDQQKLIGL